MGGLAGGLTEKERKVDGLLGLCRACRALSAVQGALQGLFAVCAACAVCSLKYAGVDGGQGDGCRAGFRVAVLHLHVQRSLQRCGRSAPDEGCVYRAPSPWQGGIGGLLAECSVVFL